MVPPPPPNGWIKVIKDVGFPIVVATGLLWMLMRDVPARVDATHRMATDLLASAAVQADMLRGLDERHRAHAIEVKNHIATTEQLFRVALAICINSASNSEGRARCLDAAGR